jgi:hypothetical protein
MPPARLACELPELGREQLPTRVVPFELGLLLTQPRRELPRPNHEVHVGPPRTVSLDNAHPLTRPVRNRLLHDDRAPLASPGFLDVATPALGDVEPTQGLMEVPAFPR